ncbi:MAG: DUF1934 domain-containing protein [Clostridia bacterium]|nr:DUF1934 domain-containing protein [Clostridia bacterium]
MFSITTDRKAMKIKMKENAMISLKTLQNIDGDEEVNEIELQTQGKFAEKNGKFYIIYQESELTGFEDTTTTIKVSEDSVSMTRTGKYNSKMVFRRGEKCLCSYATPYGVIPVGVNPTLLESKMDDQGGKVNIEYILDIDNRDYLKNRLNLTVTKTTN